MNEMDAITFAVVQKSTTLLDACIESLLMGDTAKAKEFSMQAKSILDVVENLQTHPILHNYKKKLSVALERTNPELPSTAVADVPSDVRTISPPKSTKLNTLQPTPQVHNTKFTDIIGNTVAKESLYENIVLPMLLPPHMKNKLYSGIRSNAGNVLLFGPPGMLTSFIILIA